MDNFKDASDVNDLREGSDVNDFREGPDVNDFREGPDVNDFREGPDVNDFREGPDLIDFRDVSDVIDFREGSDEQIWKSGFDEDEDECEEISEAELANNPDKRILWAAENNKLDVAEEMLVTNPHLVKSCDSDKYTPLHRASYNNHKDMAQLLLSHGADITSKTADGWQPLHSAARWNSVETAQLLIDAGADVNAQTNGSLTPLHMAASEPENGQMLELLLNCPFIDTTIKSKAGETAREVCYRCSPNYKLFDLMDDCINIFPNSS